MTAIRKLSFATTSTITPANRTAYVYWGSADGYKAERKTELPTVWAAGVAAADLNGDGYPELIFANHGAETGAEDLYPDKGLASYIYWGSATGFDAAHPTLLPTKGARDVTVADINKDGYLDIALSTMGQPPRMCRFSWVAQKGMLPIERSRFRLTTRPPFAPET